MAGRFFWTPHRRATFIIYNIISGYLNQRSPSTKLFTSSGSISLNSIPLPVQTMAAWFPGSFRRAKRNCQSWSDPRRWMPVMPTVAGALECPPNKRNGTHYICVTPDQIWTNLSSTPSRYSLHSKMYYFLSVPIRFVQCISKCMLFPRLQATWLSLHNNNTGQHYNGSIEI